MNLHSWLSSNPFLHRNLVLYQAIARSLKSRYSRSHEGRRRFAQRDMCREDSGIDAVESHRERKDFIGAKVNWNSDISILCYAMCLYMARTT